MDLGTRIRAVRKACAPKMTQKEFGEKIGVSMAVVTSYELNKATPPEPTIRLMCQTFGVNYDWLKNGVEPMMVPKAYLDRAKVENILDGDNEFVKQVFVGLADMPEEWWKMAEQVLRGALDAKKDR